jgi:hypothetical protein
MPSFSKGSVHVQITDVFGRSAGNWWIDTPQENTIIRLENLSLPHVSIVRLQMPDGEVFAKTIKSML